MNFTVSLKTCRYHFRRRVESNRGDLNVMMVGVTNSVDAEIDQETSPKLLVKRVEFEAPYYAEWPLAAHKDVFFKSDTSPGNEVEYGRDKSFARFHDSRFIVDLWTTAELDRVHSIWRHIWGRRRCAANKTDQDKPESET